MRLTPKFLLSIFVFMPCMAGAAPPTIISNGLSNSDSLRLRYFDPEIGRRSPFDVGNIDSDEPDFDVRMKCTVISCDRSTLMIAPSMKAAQLSRRQCPKPFYGRIDFFAPNTKQVVLTAHFDDTGYCMYVNGKSYRLKESLIWELDHTALSKW